MLCFFLIIKVVYYYCVRRPGHYYYSLFNQLLDAGRVEHDTNGRTERLRGKGSLELSTNLSTGTMGTSNLSPNSASLGTVNFLLGTVDESDAFTEISASFALRTDVFEFENRSGGGLGVLGATVSHMTSLNKESTSKKRREV